MKRKIIEINEDLCDGCGQCIIGCAEGALEIIDGKAKLVSDKYCDGLGACLGECPQGALQMIEREADPFDEDAVEERLGSMKQASPPAGCPGARMETMKSTSSGDAAAGPTPGQPMAGFAPNPSALTHWPIQLRLVPPTAEFLKDANVLLAADCTAASLPDFHSHFLPGKVLLMGCPKFDDADSYVEKLTDIMKANQVRSFTVLEMEVPCCGGLHRILEEAMRRADCRVPAELTIIARNGEVKGTKPIPQKSISLDKSGLQTMCNMI